MTSCLTQDYPHYLGINCYLAVRDTFKDNMNTITHGIEGNEGHEDRKFGAIGPKPLFRHNWKFTKMRK